MKIKLLLNLLLLVPMMASASLKLELVKDKLDIVWGMDFIDAENIILTEKSGKIKILNIKTKKEVVLSGNPPVFTGGQGGLLDIKLHPKFKENKLLYFTFSRRVGKAGTTVLGSAKLVNNKLVDYKDLFIGVGESKTRVHFGSRIAFSNDGKLFFTIGERGERANAQDLENHFGKVMRLNMDGGIPKDNPFVGKDGLDEIWSYGHRNPQGLFFDKESNTLYEIEHGPRGGDEINIIVKAKNYGWPKQSYGKEYMLPMSVGEEVVNGVEAPIKYYVPSIAPSGLTLYKGEKYPEFKGKLLSGALKLTHLNVFDPKTKKETRYFEGQNMRVRSVVSSPDDYLYISTDGGKVFKIIRE